MSRTRVGIGTVLGLALAAASGVAGVALAAGGTTVVVSPSGDDSAPGTASRPVRTLPRARDLARAGNRPTGRRRVPAVRP
jgi:hypothetical protein